MAAGPPGNESKKQTGPTHSIVENKCANIPSNLAQVSKETSSGKL